MKKVPIQLYGYQREWPTQRTVVRFMAGMLVVLVLFGLETLWELVR